MMIVRACYMIGNVCMKMAQTKAPMETQWNEMFQQELIEMSRVHTMLITFQIFRDGIKSSWLQENTKKHLCTLCKIFAAHDVLNDNTALYECGYFSKTSDASHSELLREYLKTQLVKLRPQILSLIESFDNNDNILNSCIGNSYGDIYENQLECAVNSELNKRDMFPDFEKYMQPFYKAKM